MIIARLYILLLIFPSLNTLGQGVSGYKEPAVSHRVRLSENSFLHINGSSNINKFSCSYAQFSQPDTLVYTRPNNSRQLNFNNAVLKLNVDDFDCGNRLMNSDLRELLRAEEHPNIRIKFKKLSLQNTKRDVPGDGQNRNHFLVDIEIAGTTREAVLYILDESQIDREVTYYGTLDLNIIDFGLQPPSKLMGLIKVEEKIQVEIALLFNILDN